MLVLKVPGLSCHTKHIDCQEFNWKLCLRHCWELTSDHLRWPNKPLQFGNPWSRGPPKMSKYQLVQWKSAIWNSRQCFGLSVFKINPINKIAKIIRLTKKTQKNLQNAKKCRLFLWLDFPFWPLGNPYFQTFLHSLLSKKFSFLLLNSGQNSHLIWLKTLGLA